MENIDFRAIPFLVTPYMSSLWAYRNVDKNMTWYRSLKKPVFTPPSWVFGPMWSGLYCCMGFASYLVWRDGDYDSTLLPLSVYAAHLPLNWSWTWVFFKSHKINASVGVILAVWGSSIACALLFRPVNKLASNLMLPYVAWLSLASAVNIGVAVLNRDGGQEAVAGGKKD